MMGPNIPRHVYVTINNATTFSNLPFEIYDMIFPYLDFFDLRFLRFTCRKFYQLCANPLKKIDLHTLSTDLSRPHVRQLMGLTTRQASDIRELSICSPSGKPLGLGYRVLPSWLMRSRASRHLKEALKRLKACRTLRISAMNIETVGYGPAWMGAIDVTLLVLAAFHDSKIPIESVHMDFRTDNAAALLHGGLEQLMAYQDARPLPFTFGASGLNDVSLSLNANITKDHYLSESTFPPLWATYGVKQISLDLGNGRGERCVQSLLRRPCRYYESFDVIRLRGITEISLDSLIPDLQNHRPTLRILDMVNIRCWHGSWFRFIGQLKTHFSMKELNLAWDVDESSLFTHKWRWTDIWGNPLFEVTYTGPRRHEVITALEMMTRRDPLCIHILSPCAFASLIIMRS
ncbi:hypothetical protein ASPBRDRAFT_231809 [Aspergillus brasiliensis CBS 101740]|uniref:F-box domain-containing protein n=1 Tax=Aspergillus brasiliensis (strain CBS 101740 / IMI 381727 / IBT 21946) TaxID=767769 RepID=A0A1L9UZU1_ASPBC|nr:hypothetical protein ASPBRDRAFT_231809 [Aspergillus brasiliensis CBS 101740]